MNSMNSKINHKRVTHDNQMIVQVHVIENGEILILVKAIGKLVLSQTCMFICCCCVRHWLGRDGMFYIIINSNNKT